MPAELLEREHLEELLKGADTASADYKGVGVILHIRLALAHGLGKDQLAVIDKHVEILEKLGADADQPAALGADTSGYRSHYAVFSGAEDHSCSPARYRRPEVLGTP